MFTLKISVENLIYNAKYLRNHTTARICAVVKANAYGHGDKIAEYLNDYVDCFAVSNGEEALRLRKFTYKPIYVLAPSADIGDGNVIYSAMSKFDLNHKRICVKVNSGMNRLGIFPKDVTDFLLECKRRNVKVDSLYTHFSDVSYAPIQFERFMSIEADIMRHACASNFLYLDKKFHLDMVRCGLALYGYGHYALRPVLSAKTDVYNVLTVKKGEKIGYSLTANKDMKVAVLGVGYADSLNRQRQSFCIGGKICNTVGNICMDMCLVDVSDTNVKVGDEAEFLGRYIDGESIAKANNTIVYDVLTSFGGRCRRVYE